jgi:hypothetical protein
MARVVDWVNGNVSTAEVIDSTLADMADTAIERACSLRAKYPNLLRGGGMLTPVMDRLCDQNGYSLPPSPNPPPFTGGQCCGVMYQVEIKAQVRTSKGWAEVVNRPILEGAISDVRIERGAGGDPLYDYYVIDHHQNNCASPKTSYLQASYYTGEIYITDVSVGRTDGQPDNCGDPPSGGLPPDPAIDPDDFGRTVTICGTPNDAENQRCVDVNIDFDPFLDENGNQCFTIEGLKYCFTPDGVEKQDDETTPTDETPAPDELEPTEGDETEEQEEEDETIRYVTTEITTLPRSGKSVWHTGTGNNDYFAGYFNWTTTTSTGVYRHPTIPIRKELQIYQKPEDATGYVAYAVNGAKIKVTKYVQPQE